MTAPASNPASTDTAARALPPAAEPSRTLARAYGPILRRFFAWAFGPVAYPPDAGAELRALSEKGTVVFVGRSAVFVTFVFFQHLFLRLGVPVAEAVAGLGARLWRPWWRPIAGRRRVRARWREDIGRAVRSGHSAMVFLRRPGSLVASVLTVKDPFPELIAAQRESAKPIYLVPQLLVWERRAKNVEKRLFDVLFGDPELPGLWRSLVAFLWNRNRAFVKFGEPIDLQATIARFGEEGLDDATIARKVRGALYQHLARETRVVTGPPLKTPERILMETLRDRSLRGALVEISRERGRADKSVEREAEKCLREIAARFSPRGVELLATFFDWVFNRIYDGIEVDDESLQKVARASARMPIVVCPSHKSHVDYLVMSYVFFTRGLIPPHIAAGINLSFWPLGPLFRKGGAFFIRRSFKGDKVYTAVLKAYVKKLLRDGFSQEFFVEGGRSRTGKVLLPKYGMLSMEVDAWCDGVRPDVAFCPSWIGYEQIIEGQSYAHELHGGEKKAEDLGALLRAPKVLTSRYGRVYIRFDEPVSLATLAAQRGFDRANHTEDQKRALVRALGFRVVEGINRVTAVTPSGLLCTALLAHDRRGLAAPDIVDRMEFLLALALEAGGRPSFHVDPGDLDPLGETPLGEARAQLERSKSIVVHSGGGENIFTVNEKERVALDYYKNTCLHFFVPDALFATGLLTAKERDRDSIETHTLAMSRLFKQEFIYGARPFSQIFRERVQRWLDRGFVEELDGRLAPTQAGAPRLRLLADLLVNYVESYAATAEGLLLLLSGPKDAKELMKHTLDRARAAYLAGRIRRFESLSKVTFENAFALFEEQGLVTRAGDKGKLRALGPAFATKEALEGKVASIRAFLVDKSE